MSSLFALYANDAYMSAKGVTARDRAIGNARYDFERKVVDNPGYVGEATRNGVPQRFLVTRSDVTYRCSITAYPGEDLAPGDIIEFEGTHWIMYQTRITNSVQISGTAWLCNHKFRFQTFSSEIHERWGVLDSGVYSTSRTSDSTIMSLDMQYRIFLPGDPVTELIHEDQRIATDKWVDQNGNPILLVYAITGRDRISKSYGDEAHLLVLNARNSPYNPEKDNFEEMVCDYISEDIMTNLEDGPLPSLAIDGRNYIRIGSSRTYKPVLYLNDVQLDEIPTNMNWHIVGPGEIVAGEQPDRISIKLPDSKSLVGEVISLTVSDPEGRYHAGSLEIEVTL